MTISPLSVPVGASLSPEAWVFRPGFRTEAQFAAVSAIVLSPDFAFSCLSQVFEPETDSDYRGSFAFTWYDKAGSLRCSKVTPSGRVREVGR
jgi:hypothetical protein